MISFRNVNSLFFGLVAFIMTMMPAIAFAAIPEEEQEETGAPNLFQRIEEESGGNVTFEIPENIADKILSAPVAPKRPERTQNHSTRPGIHRQQGYRIQVFSDGRNQSSLEARAKARGNAIANRFPKYRGQVYTFSSSPNWYTRVGNFTSASQASAAMAELKRAFPAFAGEMRVVKCKIVLIK